MPSPQTHSQIHIFLYICPETVYTNAGVYVYSLKYQHTYTYTCTHIYSLKIGSCGNTLLKITLSPYFSLNDRSWHTVILVYISRSFFMVTFSCIKITPQGFPGGAVVENLPANAGTRVRALVWEDPTCRGAAGPVSHNY